MVRPLTFMALLMISHGGLASERPMSAEDLKAYFSEQGRKKLSAAERMKAAEFDSDSLRLLSDEPVTYQFPNGQSVLGMILDNGKVSPAIQTDSGLVPACVTRDYSLVAGTWNPEIEQIQCELKASELAFIDNQVSSDGSRPHLESNRYGRKPTKEVTVERKTVELNSGKIGSNTLPLSSPSSEKQNSTATQTSVLVENPNIYVPPSRNSSGSGSAVGVLNIDRGFGILKGTWVKGRIDRAVTNGENGQIEIVLTEGLKGRFKTLPEGTVLFAEKAFNSSNQRLEAVTKSAITPNGGEFDGIYAYVYSMDKSAGLSGIIQRDIDGEVKTSSMVSAINVARTLLPSSGVLTNAASDVANDLLDNQLETIPGKPDTRILVSPQEVYLKVSETF